MMTIFERLTWLEKQAGEFGFRWSHPSQIFDQIQSECQEIQDNLALGGEKTHLQEEIGDLLHAVFCLCVFYELNAEETLVKSLDKFEKRFTELKRLVIDSGQSTLQGQPVTVLMEFWNQAKQSVEEVS
jgi:uncharacterized protein YabN with tetrapyrrole methylase and pyrophosphatase domain